MACIGMVQMLVQTSSGAAAAEASPSAPSQSKAGGRKGKLMNALWALKPELAQLTDCPELIALAQMVKEEEDKRKEEEKKKQQEKQKKKKKQEDEEEEQHEEQQEEQQGANEVDEPLITDERCWALLDAGIKGSLAAVPGNEHKLCSSNRLVRLLMLSNLLHKCWTAMVR